MKKQSVLFALSALICLTFNACSGHPSASVPEPTPPLFKFGTNVTPDGRTFQVDGKGFIDNGQYVLPVMGEIHYCRVPESEWKREVLKMKAGGIDKVTVKAGKEGVSPFRSLTGKVMAELKSGTYEFEVTE